MPQLLSLVSKVAAYLQQTYKNKKYKIYIQNTKVQIIYTFNTVK